MPCLHPHVQWAERKDKLFISVLVSNATNVNVNFQTSSVTVTGSGLSAVALEKPEPFEITINLQKEIDAAKGSFKVLGQTVQVLAMKAASGPYWGRLTLEPSKATKQWLSADWNLWRDEDEEKEGEKVDFGGYGDLSNLMQGMNGGGAMPEMPDSDDEEGGEEADLGDLDA